MEAGMKNFKRHIYTAFHSIITIWYALSMIFLPGKLLLIIPPARYILITVMLVDSIFTLISIYRGNKKLLGWALVFQSLIWSALAYLYVLHPFNTHGYILATGMAGSSLISLSRGDY